MTQSPYLPYFAQAYQQEYVDTLQPAYVNGFFESQAPIDFAGDGTVGAGTGVTLSNGQTGAGIELAITGSGYDSIALNNANDTVVGGSGTSIVLGGAGKDVYGFLNGHAGGNETIYNLNTATDTLVFGGYTGSPIAAEAVGGGGDVLKLTDGTTITLAGVDHTLFT